MMATKSKYIVTASVLALLAASPALANEPTPKNQQGAAATQVQTTEPNTPSTYEKVKTSVSNAANDAAKATEDAYEDVKASFLGDNKDSNFKTLTIDERQTATGMIGRKIYNTNGEAIGKVHDIILDESGRADMVVIADGEIFGLGKKVAFNYDVITNRSEDGDVIAPLSEDSIKRAVEFSYDKADAKKNVQVISTNARSVEKLLHANVVNDKNKKIGDVDNIAFKNGRASELIVGFDKVLGMGGKKAAIAFQDAQVVKSGSGFNFKLDSQKTAQFDRYTSAVN